MFGMPGMAAFPRGVFEDTYRCHSVTLLAAEQQRDPEVLENSDKIILPPSALEKLSHLEIAWPMLFELTNPRCPHVQSLHCGVLEFIAQEGMIYLPYWMMGNMSLQEGDFLHLRSATIPKGKYVKLQPQSTDFIKISNPKAVLETTLRNFSALTKGETIRILYNKKKYDIGVVEVKAQGDFPMNGPQAVCIIEADVEVDFAAPADYVEPVRTPQSSAASSPAGPKPTKVPAPKPKAATEGNNPPEDSSDEEDANAFKAFEGNGMRLNGKSKSRRSSSSTSPSAGSSPGSGQSLMGGGKTLGGSATARPGQTIGGGVILGGGRPLGGAQTQRASATTSQTNGAEPAKSGDYWANLGGGNTLR